MLKEVFIGVPVDMEFFNPCIGNKFYSFSKFSIANKAPYKVNL